MAEFSDREVCRVTRLDAASYAVLCRSVANRLRDGVSPMACALDVTLATLSMAAGSLSARCAALIFARDATIAPDRAAGELDAFLDVWLSDPDTLEDITRTAAGGSA